MMNISKNNNKKSNLKNKKARLDLVKKSFLFFIKFFVVALVLSLSLSLQKKNKNTKLNQKLDLWMRIEFGV